MVHPAVAGQKLEPIGALSRRNAMTKNSPFPTLRCVPSHAVFDRLNELGAQPSRQPDGSIRARGICHGGDNATALKLTPTSDRRWLAKCFKKDCDTGHI